MIKTENLCKAFGKLQAVHNVTLSIADNCIFGLAGTNGAGKSTLLRMLSGVLKQDSGKISMDDREVYENPEVKEDIFFLPDTAYFFQNATMKDMADYYSMYYPRYDKDRFHKLVRNLGLDEKRKISTFSKGMKRQASLLLGVCSGTKYLFCDETFDGLDPVMRQAAKSILAYEVTEREFTPVIASHNLRELEDICDHVGLLHKGGVLLSKDVEEMKLQIHKVQCVIPEIQAYEVTEREFTPVIASHNLRELEDICDHVGLLHKGGVLLSKDVEEMKLQIHKVQCVIPEIQDEEKLLGLEDICDHVGLLHKGGVLLSKDVEEMKLQIHKVQCVIPEIQDEEKLLGELDVLQMEKRLSLLTMVVRGSHDEIMTKIQEKHPLFAEAIPLTLEEIFIRLSKDVEEMKLQIHKVQCVIPEIQDEEKLLGELDVLQMEKRLSLLTMVVRGSHDEIMTKIQEKHPLFAEAIPLTLEEIFISETEVAGYDIKKLFM